MRFCLFLLLVPLAVFSQTVSLVEKKPLQVDRFIGVDSYQASYSITDNILSKKNGSKQWVFSDFSLGEISYVDLINPLKILLFYQETNTVVFLDNTLNEIERFDVTTFPQQLFAGEVTQAGNNMLWIFDEFSRQLIIYNYRFLTLTYSSPYLEGTVLCQTSDFNRCYLLFEDRVEVFNNYGSSLYKTPVSGFVKLVVNKQTMLGVKENKLYCINQEEIKPVKLPLDEITIKDLFLFEEFLYIYDGKTVYKFSITYPEK